MIRWRSALVFALVGTIGLAACGGSGLPGPTGGPASTDASGDFTFPPFQGPTNRPSGARVRVFNAFSPVTSEPGAIDVYGASFVDETSTPLATVPYGTLSAFFDPTVMDEDGNGFLAFYPAGRRSSDDQLMSQSFTLHAGDIETVFITTARNFEGTFTGSTHVFDHHPAAGGLANTPRPGEGLLVVVSTGLDEVLGDPDESWFISFGSGCEPGIGNEPGSGITTAVSPGQTGATYDISAGQHTVSVHAQAPDAAPTCSTPAIAEAQVEAKPDVTDVFFLYAPKAGDLRSIMVPLEP